MTCWRFIPTCANHNLWFDKGPAAHLPWLHMKVCPLIIHTNSDLLMPLAITDYCGLCASVQRSLTLPAHGYIWSS